MKINIQEYKYLKDMNIFREYIKWFNTVIHLQAKLK